MSDVSLVVITTGVVFHRSKRQGRLKLSAEAVASIQDFIQDKPGKMEAGGVLLGRRINESHDVIIDLVTLPQPSDKRRRFSFFRKHRAHQNIIEKAWIESNGSCNYLGEWHTHPEPTPVPSHIDLKSWKKQIKNTRFEWDSLFFIIFGTKDMRVFEITKGEDIVHALLLDNTL